MNDTFDKDVNLLKGIFLAGEMGGFLAVGWDSPQSPGFSTKVREKGDSPYMVGATMQHQRKDIFCKKGGYKGCNSWEIILLDTVLY